MKQFKKALSGLMVFAMLLSTMLCSMAVTASAAEDAGSLTYWFNEQANLQKGTYEFANGTVELFADFAPGRNYKYDNHTSYQGKSTYGDYKSYAKGSTSAIGSSSSAIPVDGNAYSFTPNADGTARFYGATSSGRTYNFLTVDTDGTVTLQNLNNTSEDTLSIELDVKGGYTYYMLANGSTNNTAFIGFEYVVATPITVSGQITKVNADNYSYPTQITFTPNLGQAVTADVNSSNGTFKAVLIAGKEYEISTNSSELMILSPQSIIADASLETSGLNVEMTVAQDETVTGQVYGLTDYSGVSITFTKGNITKTVDTFTAEGKYTVELQPGTYSVYATEIPGYVLSSLSEQPLVVMQSSDPDAENWKNILYMSTPAAATADTVYVDGSSNGANHYDTINDAIAGLKSGKMTDGATVVLTSGQTYTEQVNVNVPNVKFESSGADPATISWYYGIGYIYYSADPSGYYNEEYAVDRHAKHGVTRWGSAVLINEVGFEAENVIFENSFNIKVTPQEIEDGVTADPSAYSDTSITLNRTVPGFDPQTRAATERAAAIVINVGNAAFENCKFYSSQDTFYSQGNVYLKNCLVSGGIDYLFNNSGAVIMDDSTLEWKGYSANPAGGYITAARGIYIFRNCEITKGDLSIVKGYYGRPWGANADVTFIDTITNGYIADAGWNNFSVTVAQAKLLGSYNSTTNGTTPFVTTLGKNLTLEEVGTKIDPAYDVNYFTTDWLPFNHVPYVELPGATVTWNFAIANTNLADYGTNGINKTTGTVTVNNNKLGEVSLFVNATNGKFSQRASDAQFNAGTIIQIPVYQAGDVITVSLANSNYTLGGASAPTYTATDEDLENGYVELIATGSGSNYIYSITLETLYEPGTN